MRFACGDLVLWHGYIYRVRTFRVFELRTSRGRRRYKHPRYGCRIMLQWDDHRLCPRDSVDWRAERGLRPEELADHQRPSEMHFSELVPWLDGDQWRA